jgi:hypothetical protein
MTFSSNNAGTITIVDIDAGKQSRIDANIINISVDYSMSMSNELSFDVIDFNGDMYSNNYFQIGSTVVYSTKTGSPFAEFADTDKSSFNHINLVFEIANVTIGPGPGYAPLVQVKCYTKAIQQMKRDRKPGSISGTGTDFVKRAAKKYGLNLFAENTSKKRQINKASGTSQAESLWEVLQNLASEAKFVLFEADGTLFFCSQKFLMGRWGTDSEIVSIPVKDRKPKGPTKKTQRFVPLIFDPRRQALTNSSKFNEFELLQRPSITRSDNDPLDANGSAVISRANGTLLRPGMTIQFFEFGDNLRLANPISSTDDGLFLIESVSFEGNSPNPVQISFRKPEKKPKDIRDVELGKRYKFSLKPTDLQNLTALQLDKNGKAVRSKTASQNAKVKLGIPTAQMPTNLRNDNLVNPLPIQEYLSDGKYRLPRYTAALSINTATSGSMALDMYSRPIVDTGLNTVSSLSPMVVENVIEPGGTNGGLPFCAVIPRVLVNASTNVPYLQSASAASIAFVNSSASLESPLYLGKFSTSSEADEYLRLCNLQQTMIIGQRFQNRTPPISYIYPVPTSASTTNYPQMSVDSGLIEAGNIDLYNLPVKIIDGTPKTFVPYIVTGYSEPNTNIAKTITSAVIKDGYATLTVSNTNTKLFSASAPVFISNTYLENTNSSDTLFPSTWPTATASVEFAAIEGDRTVGSVTHGSGTSTINLPISSVSALKNLISNSSFEVNTTGWSTQNGATVTRITTDYLYGTACAEVTSSSSNYNNINSGLIPINASATYTLSAYAKNTLGSTRNVYIAMQWYTSSSVLISERNSANSGSLAISDGWVRRSCSGSAPANASFAKVSLLSGTTGLSAGWKTQWDGVLLEETSLLNTYYETGGASSASITVTSPHAKISPVTYSNNQHVLVLNGLWTSGSKTSVLSQTDALNKYYGDGYFLARCSTYEAAQNYIALLEEQQKIVLGARFPSGTITETL